MASYQPPCVSTSSYCTRCSRSRRPSRSLPGYEEATTDMIDAVLEEGGKVVSEVVFPLNRTGDEEGCKLVDGQVKTPTGFKEAYRTLQEGGWFALGCDPEHGGQGLPHTVAVSFEELLCSANMAFSLYPGLSRGAYVALKHHASEALLRDYVGHIVDGSWSGVMCLTEPHCGTDLGLLRTRAEPADDGSYNVTGTKIFISGGDQDLTENILHLVLARLPDAPKGVKGISMFLVPKFVLNDDGGLGERNTVQCGSIEKKMGIKGTSTCVMNYDGAKGYLVGEPHRGLNAMFSMMNHERLMVGQQGLALAEVAYQSAAEYAKDRIQGRALDGPKNPDKAADPIIVHPDVRRMLLTARAHNEGARALLAWISLQVDISEKHPDAAEREAAGDLVALMTPVIKAYFTDYGSEACNLCLQVLGGHGYIAEWGMEQLVRDARIAQIYEGANGIHALDLVARKLPMHDGRLFKRYASTVRGLPRPARRRRGDERVRRAGCRVAGALEEATAWIMRNRASDPNELGASSYDYLKLMALTALGHAWAWSAAVALQKAEGDNTGYYENKVTVARFFMRRLLPQTASLLESLRAGSDSVMALDAEAF